MADSRSYAPSWLALEQGLGTRPVLQGSALEMRAQFDGLVEILGAQYPPISPTVRTADFDVDGLKLRVYSPSALSPGTALPVGLFSHAGGFVMGSLDSEDPLCRAIVENTGTILVSVDYKLGPEYKSPAQHKEMLTAVKWVHTNGCSFQGDEGKIFTIGTSAGAGLALSATRAALLRHEDLPIDVIKGVVALAPVTLHPENVPPKFQGEYLSYRDNGENVPIINKSTMDECFASIAVQPTDPKYFVGLDEESHKSFPPTYVVTCDFDPLRADGTVLVGSLRSNGIKVKHDHYPGLPHCFWIFPSLPETKIFLENMFEGIRWVLMRS